MYKKEINKKQNKKQNYKKFWEFIRVLKIELGEKFGDINICWNNLDKIHYKLIDKDDKKTGKCIKIYKEDEPYLNQKIPNTDKTLLQTEISIVKPDAVLFVTGPSYVLSMQTALNLGEITQPTKKNPIVRIDADPNTCMFWTYHPANQFNNDYKAKILNAIIEKLRDLL